MEVEEGKKEITWKEAKETSKSKKTDEEIEKDIPTMEKEELINSISGILDFFRDGSESIKNTLKDFSKEDLKIVYEIINKHHDNMESLYEIDEAIKTWIDSNKDILEKNTNVKNLLNKLQQHQLNIIKNFLEKIKPAFEKIKVKLEVGTKQGKDVETIKNFYDNLIQLVTDKLDVLEKNKEGLVNEITKEQEELSQKGGGGSLKNNNVKQLHYFYKYIKYKTKCDNLLDEMKYDI
jgi:hypothetical protein